MWVLRESCCSFRDRSDGTENRKPPTRRRADLAVAQTRGARATARRGPVLHVRKQHGGDKIGAQSGGVKSWMKKIPCFDCPVACFRSGYSAISGETLVPAMT